MNCYLFILFIIFLLMRSFKSHNLDHFDLSEIKYIKYSRHGRTTRPNQHWKMKIKGFKKQFVTDIWSSGSSRYERELEKIKLKNYYLLYKSSQFYVGRIQSEANSVIFGFADLKKSLFFGYLKSKDMEYFFDHGIIYNQNSSQQIIYMAKDIPISAPIDFKKCEFVETENGINDSKFEHVNKRGTSDQKKVCAVDYIISEAISQFFINRLSNYDKQTYIDVLVTYLTTINHVVQELFDSIKNEQIVEFRLNNIFVISSQMCKTYKNNIMFSYYCRNKKDQNKLLTFMEADKRRKSCAFIFLDWSEYEMESLGLASIKGLCTIDKKYNLQNAISINNILLHNKNSILSGPAAGFIIGHELGHMFGAYHDDNKTDCPNTTKSSNNKYYVMHSSFTSLAEHERMFSQCSKIAILKNLKTLKRYRSCLNPSIQNKCHNGVLDINEECDCGFSRMDNTCSACCTNQCKLHANAFCSPFGDCGAHCDQQKCTWYRRSKDTSLRPMCQVPLTDCHEAQYCDISKPKSICKKAPTLPNGSLCAHRTRMCKAGACTENICSNSACSLAKDHADFPNFDIDCLIACNVGGKCKSNFTVGTHKPPFHKLNGTTCNNGKGFCMSGICKLYMPKQDRYTPNLDPCLDLAFIPMLSGVTLFIFLYTICITLAGSLIFLQCTKHRGSSSLKLMFTAVRNDEKMFWMKQSMHGRDRSQINYAKQIRTIVRSNNYMLRDSSFFKNGAIEIIDSPNHISDDDTDTYFI